MKKNIDFDKARAFIFEGVWSYIRSWSSKKGKPAVEIYQWKEELFTG